VSIRSQKQLIQNGRFRDIRLKHGARKIDHRPRGSALGRIGVKAMIANTADGTRYRQAWAPARTASLVAVRGAIHTGAERARWAVWRWRQVHQTTKQLSALPDHMLRDIGLSRSTLISATTRRVREEEAIRRAAYG